MSVFQGLRVWDASWVGVGPLTARYLADYGATVVRTETLRSPDVLRWAPPFKDGEPGLNRSQFFADYNASKLGLGLDLSHPDGREIGERLVRWADVVIESFSPGVFGRLGFSPARVHELNPTAVLLSTSMNGQSGPRSGFGGFGNVLAAMGGFCELTGWPDRPPSTPYGAYTDFIAQRFATAAVLAALEHRDRTGQGQAIDLSQLEAGLQFLEPELLDLELSDHVATRGGNRHDAMAPHGVFPCLPEQGRERWVAIAVATDAQWNLLASKLGRPAWTRLPALSTLAGRKEHETEIERRLSDWTCLRTRDEVVSLLQPSVPAGHVNDPADLHEDAQIRHRGYFHELDHSVMGAMAYEGSQAVLSSTQPGPSKAAPALGEDTSFVLTELLGLPVDEVESLLARGAVECSLPPREHAAPAPATGHFESSRNEVEQGLAAK